jgi:UDP-N-acetylglucosamine 2-epimerase (non-hydrolysing)
VLSGLLQALGEVARSCPLVLPAHPRAVDRLRAAGVPDGIRIIPPAGYLDFVALQHGARIVLTDSGGVQEETTVLGVPCVTLRDSTERPVTLTEGTNRLAGTDARHIVEVAVEVLEHPPAARRPALWDGHAADRIAEALLAWGAEPQPLRPTSR